MSIIDPTRVINNLIALFIVGWVFFLIYSKIDKERTKETWDNLKNLFGGKKE